MDEKPCVLESGRAESVKIIWLVNREGDIEALPQLHPLPAMLQVPRGGRGAPHLAIPEHPIQASCSAAPALAHVRAAA